MDIRSESASHLSQGASDKDNDTSFTIYILLAVQFVLAIATVFVNVLILIGFTKSKEKLSSHCIIITGLCVSNIAVGVGQVVLDVALLFPSHYCVHISVYSFNTGMFFCSICSIAAMSVYHYIATVQSSIYVTFCNRKWEALVVGLILIISVLFGIVRNFVALHLANSTDDLEFCDSLYDKTISEIYFVFPIVLVSIIILLFTNIHICQHIGRLDSNASVSVHSTSLRTEYRAVMTTIWMMVLVYAVAWIPLVTLWMYVNMNKHISHRSVIIGFITLVPIFNSACNTLVYVIRVSKVKVAFKKALCCFYKDEDSPEENETISTVSTNVMYNNTGRITMAQQNT